MAAKKPKPEKTSVPLPFNILIDSNESQTHHDAWTFQGIASNADTNHLPFEVTPEIRFLEGLGDYSADFTGCADLGPWEQPIVMIERKSKADLFGSVTDGDNMEHRLNRLDVECEFAAVVVEAELGEMMRNPPPFTKQTFKVIHARIQSWQQRFRRVHWMFYPDREVAELGAFWYLYRFYQNIKKHASDKHRRQYNYKCFYEGMQAFKKKKLITECPIAREHRIGDPVDYWVRGWIVQQNIGQGRPFEAQDGTPLVDAEASLIPPEIAGDRN